jgi:hypothetical protein
LALAAVAAGSLAPTAAVTAPRTIDREFRFLLATLPSLPPDARIFYTYPSSDQNADLGLRAPVWMSKAVGRPEQRWEEWRPDGPPPPGAGPRFYLHQGTCSVAALDLDPEGRALASRLGPERCADAIARFGGAPAAEVLVPAARFASDWYVSDPVRIGLYRME